MSLPAQAETETRGFARTAAATIMVVACVPAVVSSAVVTHPAPARSASTVSISATRDPAGAQEIGIVEAHGRRPQATAEALVAEFRSRVAMLGGDFGRIDDFATRHELRTESRDYECGGFETQMQTQSVVATGPDGSTAVTTEAVPVTTYVAKTCTEERQVEDATLTLVGRAFRTAKGSP
jgi:hypothetical protein